MAMGTFGMSWSVGRHVDAVTAAGGGNAVAAASALTGAVWDGRVLGLMSDGSIDAEIEVEVGMPDLACLDDGQFVAACDDGSVRVIHSGGVLPLPGGHRDIANAVAVSTERRLVASAGADHSILCWDLNEPANDPFQFEGHKESVSSVDWSGNMLLSSSKDGRVCVWDARVKPWQAVARVKVGSMALTAAFGRSGERVVVATEAMDIQGYDIRGGAAMTPVWRERTKAQATRISECPQNSNVMAIATDAPSVMILQVESGEEVCKPLVHHTDFVRGIAWDPQTEGKLFTGSWDKTVCEWNLKVR